MKFKSKVSGLVTGLNPIFTVATKGIQKDYPQASLITLKADKNHVEAIADGGHVSASNAITDQMYKLDYVMLDEGSVTVNSNDLKQILSSFSPEDLVVFELREVKGSDGGVAGKELAITLDSDTDQFQTLPVHETDCQFQKPVLKKSNKMTIRRDVFNEYAGKIMFAHGFELSNKKFLYWVLRHYGNTSYRFVAGSGQRFAVVDLVDKDGAMTTAETSILFPNEQTQTIIGVLGDLTGDDVQIESHDRFISVSCDNVRMSLYTCDPAVEWPDENRFLSRQNKFCITTKILNWRNAVGGIMATYNADARKKSDIPTCILTLDLAKRIMQAKSDSSMKSVRKITVDDIDTNEAGPELTFRCNSNYVNEIISKASDEDYIQIEIESPDMPIIIRHYAGQNVGDPLTFKKPNEDGLSERYSVFFATVKK